MENGLPGASPAEIQTPPQTFEAALKEAQTGFYDLTFEDGFDERIKERNIGEDDTHKPEYWRAAADFAYDRATQKQEFGTMDELFAATPDFIYQQAHLARGRNGFASQEAYDDARRRASYYHGLLGEVVQKYPDASASALEKALVGVTNISVENEAVKLSSVNIIKSRIRGAQHEVAFGQLLEATGREFRQATVEEDLQGVDYVVMGRRGREFQIDVKASLKQVNSRAGEGNPSPYAVEEGRIIMYSMLSDRDLGDKFSVSDAVAARKGEAVDEILDDMELGSTALVVGSTSVGRWTS
jgi:hypothetical protein